MKKTGIVVYYAVIAALGIFLFISIRWYVIHSSPVFYEKTNRKVMTPEQVIANGIEFDSEKQYYQVEKKRIYLKAAKYPRISKETTSKVEVEVQPLQAMTGGQSSEDDN